jgi:N-acetyl-anhydromuramyl-L-alanine amidase AmpD
MSLTTAIRWALEALQRPQPIPGVDIEAEPQPSPDRLHYPFIQAKHHNPRYGVEPDLLVMHYSAGPGDELALGRFFEVGKRKASAHFGVGRPGGVAQYVALDRDALHCGPSSFQGKPRCGRRSIGVELCNRGYGGTAFTGRHRNPGSVSTSWEPYPEAQIVATVQLLAELKHAIPTLRYVTGHEDIRHGKLDPGPAWPWERLEGLGLQRWWWDFGTKAWRAT